MASESEFVCRWCGEPLRHERGRGWVHTQGGLYAMCCAVCGYTSAAYPSPARCPKCGSLAGWRDDHCALPIKAR
jgi:rubrerythrin